MNYSLKFNVEKLIDNMDSGYINFNLLLNKYIKSVDANLNKSNEEKNKKKEKKNNNKKKDAKLCSYYIDNIKNYIINKDNCALLCYGDKYEKYEITAKTCSRLIIGLGEPSVTEVSIKLDHIYGIPFVPASSFKGALKRFMFPGKEISEIEKMIFGTTDMEGNAIFLDAYPSEFEIVEDIMTPHYKDYYALLNKKEKERDQNSNDWPVDSSEPIPIKFYTVEKDAIFKFTVFMKKNPCISNVNIEEKMKAFFNSEAIGSKKTVGYGYWEVV